MRKLSRETCFKIIYKNLFIKDDFEIKEICEEENINNEEDLNYISEIIQLYKDNREEINKRINEVLVGYSPERVYSIDRALLDLAVTEIFYFKQTPIAIVVNEIVEMSKKFSTEKSYSFINGVLKTLTKE